MVNELEEFRAYTEFPEYKAEKKSDTAYLGRFTLPMLLELTGFQRIQPFRGENKKSPGSGE